MKFHYNDFYFVTYTISLYQYFTVATGIEQWLNCSMMICRLPLKQQARDFICTNNVTEQIINFTHIST